MLSFLQNTTSRNQKFQGFLHALERDGLLVEMPTSPQTVEGKESTGVSGGVFATCVIGVGGVRELLAREIAGDEGFDVALFAG